MADFDLTYVLGQYLDRHLVFPLLEFLPGKEVSFVLTIFTLIIWHLQLNMNAD